MNFKFIFSTFSLLLISADCANNFFETVSKFLTMGENRMQYEMPSQENIGSKYDFIVIGAGSAGCAIASRLSENPKWKVLLLEAGNSENLLMDIPMMVHFLQAYDVNWKYKTEPSKTSCLGMNGNQCNWPRGKVMGGSSVLNYMVYTRGHQRDFDNWADLGNDGWDFKNVSHYFRRLENNVVPTATPNFHGKNGPVTISESSFKSPTARAFVEAGLEIGYPYVDYNGPSQVGFSFLQATIENGIRKSSNAAYLYPIRKRTNLHVRKNSRVTKLLIDETSMKVYGVQFYSKGKYYEVHAVKEIVLSAGAINSPQILMLSGIGPAKHLKALGIKTIVNLAVGYNLMDHTAPGALTFTVNTTTLNMSDLLDINLLDDYFTHLEGPISVAGGVESIAFLETNKTYDPNGYPDLEFLQLAGSVSSDLIFKENFGIRDDIYDEMFGYLQSNKVDTFMVFPMVMRPKSRGRIKLRSANPFDSPAIFPNYFSDPYDIDISVRGIRKLIELSKTKAMQKVNAKFLTARVPGCKHLKYDTDKYWECYTRHFTFTIYHHCGTVKAGPKSDRRAVVDPTLKVYGVSGLRVADASIMPQIITGHTHGPVVMIGEKAADMIKHEWNSS